MRKLMSMTALVLVFAMTACATEQEPEATPAASPEPTTPPKPELQIPDGEPPAELQVIDEEVGTGRVASEGDEVVVHYVGWSWSTREEFDASYDRGEPVGFPLVRGGLIDGWVEGIPGMKVGGRRRLIVPPDKGYGTSGRGPIAPNETLVFVIDLVDVVPPQS